MDKVDIIKIAQDIDTLEISNLPFEDCCTIFTPKAPKTRPRLEKIKSYEARDDYSELIEETLASVKTYLFDKDGQVITKDISEDKVVKEDFQIYYKERERFNGKKSNSNRCWASRK